MNWLGALIGIGLGLVTAFALAPVIGWALRRIDPHGSPEAERALRGGLWIGILERASVYAAIVLAYPAGVAVVVAVKGLGRFAELKGAGGAASERFIIGSLLSVLLATLMGTFASWVISLL